MVTPDALLDVSPQTVSEQAAALSVESGLTPAALVVCLTLYNEPAVSLSASLTALARNCAALPKAGLAGSGCDGAPPGIVIVVVADGSEAMAPCTREFLAHLIREAPGGAEEGGIAVSNWEGERAFGRFSADQLAGLCDPWTSDSRPHHGSELMDGGLRETNLSATTELALHVFIKPRNAGKLDSHVLFFTRICPSLQPKFCIQMDVGTIPDTRCLPRLIAEFLAFPECVACFPTIISDGLQPSTLITFQRYDYLFGNGMKWSVQSLFNYAEVIPGQFCVLRWSALKLGSPSLVDRYLNFDRGNSALARLMLLTEDRVLAMNLTMTDHGSSDPVLSHVVDAIAVTDSCLTWPELLQQRRRWLNGSTAVHLATLTWLLEKVASGGGRTQPGKGRGLATASNSVLALLIYWLGGALPLVVIVCLAALLADPAFSRVEGWCAAGRVAWLVATSLWLLQAWQLARQDDQATRGMALIPWCSLAQVVGLAALITLASAADGAVLAASVAVGITCAASEQAAASWAPSFRRRSGWQRQPWWPLLLPVMRSSLGVYAIAHLADHSWGTKGLTQASRGRKPIARLLAAVGLAVVGLTMASIIIGWSTAWIEKGVWLLLAFLGLLAVLAQHPRLRDHLGLGWPDPWLIWLPSTAAVLLLLQRLQARQLLLELIPLILLGVSGIVVVGMMASLWRQRELQRRRPSPAGHSGDGDRYSVTAVL